MASEFRKLIQVASSLARDLVLASHRSFAAWWPHGMVASSPAPVGDDLRVISEWMRIPWPMTGSTPMPDAMFREVLKAPFTYHRSAGTVDGLISAVQALGYADVSYMSWEQLKDCPTYVPIGGGTPLFNQNAFGLKCPSFPDSWFSGGSVSSGSPLDTLIRTVMRSKRASSKLWELRITESRVVSQAWWNGPRDPSSIEYVVLDPLASDLEYVVVVG